MPRRTPRKRAAWTWLVLLGLAISAVAFGRSPEARQPSGQPRTAPQAPDVPRSVPPAQRTPVRTHREPLRLGSPFFVSELECEQALRERSRRAVRARPRVGSWNLRWFPRGTKDGRDPERRTDLRWMACAIASLEVSVLAIQEVVQDPEGRAALLDLGDRLDTLTGGRWRSALDECAGSGRQHVGFLYDSRRVELRDARAIDALNPGRSACDRSLRPGFGAHARFADGSDTQLIAVHFDSGVMRRDYDNRQRSLERLGGVLSALRPRDPDAIVLGDFNTMGCKDCMPPVSAAGELAAFDARLDLIQLKRIGAGGAGGAQCSQYYRGRAGLLDHILVTTASLRWSASSLETFGPCAALGCGPQPRNRSIPALTSLSDHCPIVAALPRPKRREGPITRR